MKTIKIFMTALISIASVIATTVTGANFASAKEKKLSDFSELELMALSKGYSVVCDHDGDGRIDLTDLSYEKMLIVGEITTTPGIELFGRSVVMGDLNYDEKVNAADAALFSALIAKKMTCEDIFLPKETEPAVTTTVTTATTPAVTTTVETTTEPVVTTTVVTTTEPVVTTTVETTTEPVVTAPPVVTLEAPSLDVSGIINVNTVTWEKASFKSYDYWYFPGTNVLTDDGVNRQLDYQMINLPQKQRVNNKITTLILTIPEIDDSYTIIVDFMDFDNPYVAGSSADGIYVRLLHGDDSGIITETMFDGYNSGKYIPTQMHEYVSEKATETDKAIADYALWFASTFKNEMVK